MIKTIAHQSRINLFLILFSASFSQGIAQSVPKDSTNVLPPTSGWVDVDSRCKAFLGGAYDQTARKAVHEYLERKALDNKDENLKTNINNGKIDPNDLLSALTSYLKSAKNGAWHYKQPDTLKSKLAQQVPEDDKTYAPLSQKSGLSGNIFNWQLDNAVYAQMHLQKDTTNLLPIVYGDVQQEISKGNTTTPASPSSATFSYTYDYAKSAGTMVAQGALLYSFIFPNNNYKNMLEHYWKDSNYDAIDPFTFTAAGIIPSASINYNPSAKSASQYADSVAFQANSFVQMDIFRDRLYDFTLTALPAYIYNTDTEHVLNIQGGSLDLEPQLHFFVRPDKDGTYDASERNGELLLSKCSLGYVNILYPWSPDWDSFKNQYTDYLDYQLRVYLHVEGGDVIHQAARSLVPDETFARLGPVVQFKVGVPSISNVIPIFKTATFNAEYQNLVSEIGKTADNSLFTWGVEFVLDPGAINGSGIGSGGSGNQNDQSKITLNLTYTKGGLDFTQQKVDSFVVALGFSF